MQPNSSKNTSLIGIIAVVILVLAIGGTIAFKSEKTDKASTSATTSDTGSVSKSTSSNTVNTSPSSFKSGTYNATGTYSTPETEESIDVTITLSGNTITGANVINHAKTRESREYQADFLSGYKSLVIGKDITSLRLSRVAGSSLTSRGFNDALDQIKSQAKS